MNTLLRLACDCVGAMYISDRICAVEGDCYSVMWVVHSTDTTPQLCSAYTCAMGKLIESVARPRPPTGLARFEVRRALL